MKEFEPTGDAFQGNSEVVSFVRKRYELKEDEFNRRRTVREYLSKYMQKLLGSEDYTNAGDNYRQSSVFTSNLMREGFEYVTTAKLDPDKIDFNPTQNSAPQEQHDTADNYASLVKYARSVGGYDKMVADGKADMAFGEKWITQEYQIRNGEIIKLKQKAIPWENVLGYYGDTDLIIRENLTVGQFVAEYGEDMLKKVQYGFPFAVNDDYKEVAIDTNEIYDKSQRIGIIKYWDYGLKRHNIIIGGGAYMPKDLQQEGKDYFWVDDDGDGFCPVKSRVYKSPSRGYHGYGVIDLLYPLAYLETVIVNASSHAAILASDPLLVFYADDITEMQNRWDQYLATKKVGSQSPFMINQSRTNPIKAEQLTFEPNINILETWRNFVLEEATVRTRIDFKLLIDYAPTDGQQKSRKYETDKTNRFVLAENSVTDKQFAMDTVYMLKRGESQFHDKELYIKVGDYFFENLAEEDKALLRDDDGFYYPVPVKIRDFLDDNPDTEFSLTPILDGVIDDQSFFEMQDARADMALLDPQTPAAVKLRDFYFSTKYGRVKFNREDFQMTPQQPEPQQGAPLTELPQ